MRAPHHEPTRRTSLWHVSARFHSVASLYTPSALFLSRVSTRRLTLQNLRGKGVKKVPRDLPVSPRAKPIAKKGRPTCRSTTCLPLARPHAIDSRSRAFPPRSHNELCLAYIRKPTFALDRRFSTSRGSGCYDQTTAQSWFPASNVHDVPRAPPSLQKTLSETPNSASTGKRGREMLCRKA